MCSIGSRACKIVEVLILRMAVISDYTTLQVPQTFVSDWLLHLYAIKLQIGD